MSVSSSSLQTEETTTVSTTDNQKKPPAVEESPQIELSMYIVGDTVIGLDISTCSLSFG